MGEQVFAAVGENLRSDGALPRHGQPIPRGPPMPIPSLPPLNARSVAEFATSRPSKQRTTLRRYARPPEQQKAPIVMYDPVRKVLPEFFRARRDLAVLQRVVALLDTPSNADPGFWERHRRFDPFPASYF